MRHSLTHLQEQTHIPSPQYRHTPKSIHPGLNPNPRPQMDRRLGETVQFFFFWSERTKTKQYAMKRKKERDLHYVWRKREREREEEETGMMGTWRMGLWEMARGKARERERKKENEGVLYVSHSGWCGLRRLPDEAQDRESTTFQTQ